ncbi:MAG: DUF932 domain-containing protein [Fibrobacteres bacterium]|nr:DUF932 domain-containing protein [Fibrobacterota bacterium]
MFIKLKDVYSADEALKAAHLDWSAEPVGLVTTNGLDVPDHKAICRSDTNKVLGVVGSRYEVLQNTQSLAICDVFSQQYQASYETAGCLREGRKVFLQMKLGGTDEVRKNDKISRFLTVLNAHDGSSSVRIYATPIRIVCQNTLNLSLRNIEYGVSIRHTESMDDRLREAFKAFNLTQAHFAKFKEMAQYLCRKQVDRIMVERFLKDLVPDTGSTRSLNQRNKIHELFEVGKGNGQDTAWDLLNGATEFSDHFRTSDPEKRLESSMVGSGAAFKQRAFELAMAL